MGSIEDLIARLGDEIEDPEEETFLLYSQPIPSHNLGFVDQKATTLEVAVGKQDFTIHQSPSVLSSSRAGGTTGAVLWKVTPPFAAWLSSPTNPLFTTHTLSSTSAVLELGCGISPLNALSLRPLIARHILTDQPYVQRFIQRNLAANPPPARRGAAVVHFVPLDWETDEVSSALTLSDAVTSFDAVLACDCVYNYALVAPFVQACVDVCRLREGGTPCVCIVAQQLRNDEVFESWLKEFHAEFRVWRMPDEELPEELMSQAGFVVHIGILRDALERE